MKRSGKAHVAKIERVCKRYVYSGRDWSKELLEANEPKSRYCSNEYGSRAGFVIERSHEPILLPHHRLAVFAICLKALKMGRVAALQRRSLHNPLNI